MMNLKLRYLFTSWVLLFLVQDDIHAKEIDSKTDLQQEESGHIPSEHRTYLPPPHSQDGGDGSYHGNKRPSGSNVPHRDQHELWPLGRPNMPQVKGLNVKCEKNHMRVNIEFDRPFYGMVFSKGHYSDQKCVHLPQGSGHISANFDIFLGACGMTSSEHGTGINGGTGSGLFIENTIIIQYDPQVQEIWDQARRLRCTWYDYYEKAVTFRPFNVDMQEAVTANFLGDNIQCWMQIQAGKGPWASEVAGIVKIGQTMTMVLAIKDDENKFDMLVRNCMAHDGKHQPIQLVDEFGCVVRPKIMSKFQRVKNFGHSATVVSYAYFQAFKFPDSMNVHFQCVIQVCRYECPAPACDGENGNSVSKNNGAGQNPSRDFYPGPRDSESKGNGLDVQQMSESTLIEKRVPVYKPATSPSSFPINVLTNRKGELSSNADVSIKHGYAIAGTGGMPRALRLNRKRRDSPIQSTDIKTQKVIQVVAPGDVSFTLPEDTNNTVIDIFASRLDDNETTICISTTGFAAGLVFLLLLLTLSCLVSAFLFIRVKHIAKSVYKNTENVIQYENPEFLKYPSIASIQLN